MEATLKKELRRQMVSTVYLEADYGCFFLNVAHAIDTIQWLGPGSWRKPEKNGALLEVKSRRLTLVVFGTEVC